MSGIFDACRNAGSLEEAPQRHRRPAIITIFYAVLYAALGAALVWISA